MLHHDSRPRGVAELEAKEHFQKVIAERVKANRAGVIQVLQSIEHVGNSLEDRIVTWGSPWARFKDGDIHKKPAPISFVRRNGGVEMLIDDVRNPFKLHPFAAGKMAESLGIPSTWGRDLLLSSDEWRRNDGVGLFNSHINHLEPSRHLIRAIDSEVRGFLSDRYRRLDSGTIIRSFLDKVERLGGETIRATYQPTRIYVEATLPHIFPVETDTHGVEYISIGVVLRNSDFGDGALAVSGYAERAWCTNKAIWKNTLRQVHLGRQIPEDLILSEETYRADTRAQASIVSDVVANVLDKENVVKHLAFIRDSATQRVDFERQSTTVLPKFKMTKGEIESVRTFLIEGGPEEIPSGPLTRWKLAQAISSTAKGSSSIARRYDLEEIAGKFISSSKVVAETN